MESSPLWEIEAGRNCRPFRTTTSAMQVARPSDWRGSARCSSLCGQPAGSITANEVLAPFGLPPLPYIRFDEEAAPHQGWKLPSIRRYVGNGPFAWIDYDISAEAHRWAESRSAPTLLLDIGADCGLGEADVERQLAFRV